MTSMKWKYINKRNIDITIVYAYNGRWNPNPNPNEELLEKTGNLQIR